MSMSCYSRSLLAVRKCAAAVMVFAVLYAGQPALSAAPPSGDAPAPTGGDPMEGSGSWFDEPSPAGCPNIPPCEALKKFKARCRLGIVGRLIVKVRLNPPIVQENVLIGVDRIPFCVPFEGRVAKLVLQDQVGLHICEVLDPPECFQPKQVDCGT